MTKLDQIKTRLDKKKTKQIENTYEMKIVHCENRRQSKTRLNKVKQDITWQNKIKQNIIISKIKEDMVKTKTKTKQKKEGE